MNAVPLIKEFVTGRSAVTFCEHVVTRQLLKPGLAVEGCVRLEA